MRVWNDTTYVMSYSHLVNTFQRILINVIICCWNSLLHCESHSQSLSTEIGLKVFCFAKHHPVSARPKYTQPGKRNLVNLCTLWRFHLILLVFRMLHRICRGNKQLPSIVRSGYQLSYCLVSLHFSREILHTSRVHVFVIRAPGSTETDQLKLHATNGQQVRTHT